MYIYYILFINMLKISVFMKTLEVFVKSDIWTLLTCSFCCLFLPFWGGSLQRNFPVFYAWFIIFC